MRSIKTILLSLAAALLVSCGTTKTVPITGRQQSLMVSDGDVLSLSTQQYQEFMKTAKLSTNAANTAMVKRVGQNLATAVTNYLNANGMAADVQNFKWTFNLVENKEANAWCMPGGLICVYEGILPLTQDEPKQQYGMQIGAAVLGGMGVGSNTSSIIQAIAAQGFNFKNLSYSRNHESEADHMGLIFAAMAGYDPQVAVAFWQRMAAASNNQRSEFLSDHPSDATRIKQTILLLLPQSRLLRRPLPAKPLRRSTSLRKRRNKAVDCSHVGTEMFPAWESIIPTLGMNSRL